MIIELRDNNYMKFFDKDIKLVIFDLDGTLIHSTNLWADIDRRFFAKRGMMIPPTYNQEIAHVGLRKAGEITKDKYLPNENVDDIISEWMEMSYEAYRDYIPLKDRAQELLEFIYKQNIPMALATANSKEIYDVCLTRLGIRQYFGLVLDVNSCKDGKNSPEIYDRAISHFNVKREETLILEDMIVPIITAHNAGYNVIAVYDEESTKDEKACIDNSDLFIKNFGEVLDCLK